MKLKRSSLITKIRGMRNGTMYSVRFVKKDGSVRVINSIKGTSKGVNGEGLKYEPTERGLIPVYDLQLAKKKTPAKDCWRMINVETAIELKVDKQTYTIED